MPTIDDGPTDGPPGKRLETAWVHLTVDEPHELLLSLCDWSEEVEQQGGSLAIGEPPLSETPHPEA